MVPKFLGRPHQRHIPALLGPPTVFQELFHELVDPPKSQGALTHIPPKGSTRVRTGQVGGGCQKKSSKESWPAQVALLLTQPVGAGPNASAFPYASQRDKAAARR